MFISFEGGEGTGKSTQIKILKKFLEENGFNVLVTREPGGTVLGNKIRNLILDPEQEDKPVPLSEILLYMADRAHHVETVLKPALKNNTVVLCDRFTDSTIAYQGFARGHDIERLELLNSIVTTGLKPSLTFVFDLDPETGLKRIKENRKQDKFDRIEAEKSDFHNKVREGFNQIAQRDPQRVKIIDASNNINDISDYLKKIVSEHLEN